MTRPVDAPDWLRDKDFELDLGDEHWAMFYTDEAHRDLEGNAAHVGIIITHRCPQSESGWMQGSAPFIGQVHWTVESWEPLTLSPSVYMPKPYGCGDHGFIRNGKWQRA